MNKLSALFLSGIMFLTLSVSAKDDSGPDFDAAFKEKMNKEEKTEEGKDAKANKFRPNMVLWKNNLKYAKAAESTLNYYKKKKDAQKIKFYSLKVQGYKMKAKGYKIGNKTMIDLADKYLLKGKPIPKKPVATKKDGSGGASQPETKPEDDMGGM
jgi:hypothetical protein